MMHTETFRTVFPVSRKPWDISHKHRILCIGSCFAEHIGEGFVSHKIPTLLNPFGVLFNPLSVAGSLQRMVTAEPVGEGELFRNGGCWHSYRFHSRFSHPEMEVCRQRMDAAVQEAAVFLRHTDYLILTLGSAMVYRLKSDGVPVANCHKMPSTLFERRMLEPDEAFEAIESALLQVRALCPDLRCILTVSPVRYIKNDFVENSLSKAVLRLLCHRMAVSHDWADYFPAFEIMTDDLRDYRFYASDRIHPSEEAVHYIWDVFSETYFSEGTRMLNRSVEEITAAFRHRTAFPELGAYRSFCRRSLNQIHALQREHPDLDFSQEERYFSAHADS